jgi:hypothetical protein
MAEWQDQDFLLRIWRRRDAQLLRLLTARNLAMIREQFDAAQSAAGLSVSDFVRVMMKLLGTLAINKEELCIQILELFANIDVRRPAARAGGGGGWRGVLYTPRAPQRKPRRRAPRAHRLTHRRRRPSPPTAPPPAGEC